MGDGESGVCLGVVLSVDFFLRLSVSMKLATELATRCWFQSI